MRCCKSFLFVLVSVVAVLWSASMTGAEAKKRRRTYSMEDQPDRSREEGRVRLMMPSVGKDYAAELANASRAATREKYWHEYQRASNAIVKVLDREAANGARVLFFRVVNPDRQFQQNGDLNRYGDVMEYMLKGNKGGMPLRDEETGSAAAQMLGCVPARERWCAEKIARAARQGSFITVENCHRWQAAYSLALSDGLEDAMSDLPEVGLDWAKMCEVVWRVYVGCLPLMQCFPLTTNRHTPRI